MVIMLVVAAVMQGMGNAKTPMYIAFIMNGINILLSFLLIFGYLGLPMLRIKGAAIATVMAQFTGALIGLYVLFSKNGILSSASKGNLLKRNYKRFLVCNNLLRLYSNIYT